MVVRVGIWNSILNLKTYEDTETEFFGWRKAGGCLTRVDWEREWE